MIVQRDAPFEIFLRHGLVDNYICVSILNPVFKSFGNLMFSTMSVLVWPKFKRGDYVTTK